MNKPVSFEIAKLLKEKGFDEYCFFIWNEENLEEPYYYAENYEMICQRIHYYGDIPMINNSYIEKYATYVEKDEITNEVYDLLATPAITEVVMWLYEKHGIWISVTQYKDHSADVNDPYVFRSSCLGFREFDSPTEAYSEAIKYVLTKLL